MHKLIDGFGRSVDYLRVAVTDKCNLRCRYCIPTAIHPGPARQPLHLAQLERVARNAAALGITRIRLTGGEPLVRPDIVDLVRAIARTPGIEEVCLSTNGTMLAGYAGALAKAGLSRVNVSLDSLCAATFASITRSGHLDAVLRGIEAASHAGLAPIKVNMVVMRGVNDAELAKFARLTVHRPWHVRFIELMPVGHSSESRLFHMQHFVPVPEMKRKIAGLLCGADVAGNGPAEYYRIAGALGTVGFISPLTNPPCPRCNRIRLTAAGLLKPCLFSEQGVEIGSALEKGADDVRIQELIELAVSLKPRSHRLGEGAPLPEQAMLEVGG